MLQPLLPCLSFLLLAACLARAGAQTPTLAPTPPMGWASWNHYFCDYDENTIRGQADALVSTGLRDLGYKYVLIQECIAPRRNTDGSLITDPKRFPHGIPALVRYIHDRGLKAGIYTDIGTKTCFPNPRYEGIYGHEEQDIRTFASWGMDLVEVDYCNRVPQHSGREIYDRVAAAIRGSGRPMLLYICSWGNELPWEWAPGVAQMWRTDFDVSLQRNRAFWDRIVSNFESNGRHAVFNAPGGWNDPDMLEVGNPGLSGEEAQSTLAMWAISAAPLLLGNDLTAMDGATGKLLLNPEVVAIDQDALGAQAAKLCDQPVGREIWVKPLGSKSSGKVAVLMLNLTNEAAAMNVRWADLGLDGGPSVRDVFARRDLAASGSEYRTELAGHGAQLLAISGRFSWKHGVTYEAEWPGNEKRGEAELFTCGECSSGYAVTLGSDGGKAAGSIVFHHVDVTEEGEYRAILDYVRNGLGDQTVRVTINGGAPQDVRLSMHMVGAASFPTRLRRGANSIAVESAGPHKVFLDKVRLEKGSKPR